MYNRTYSNDRVYNEPWTIKGGEDRVQQGDLFHGKGRFGSESPALCECELMHHPGVNKRYAVV